MAEVIGKSIVEAWRKRGGDDADLAEIIDTVLAGERGMRDAYRDHVDVEQTAKNRVRSLEAKYADGTISAEDFALHEPPRTLEPIEEIDAKRDAARRG